MKSYFLLALIMLSTTNLYSANALRAAAANAGANRDRLWVQIQDARGVHVWVANPQPGLPADLPKRMEIIDSDGDTEMSDR